jgi:ribose 1,5-bisphosphokinase PhnN
MLMSNWQYIDTNFGGVIHKNSCNKQIKNIVIVGPHASGKTYMFNHLKSVIDHDKFSFPKRLTSRPVRLNDDIGENTFTDREEINSAKPLISWQRPTTDSEDEYYAFTNLHDDKIAVLSANNGILPSIQKTEGLVNFANSLIVCIYAPLEIRQERILDLTPDLRSEERYKRLKESVSDILPESDVLVLNFEPFVDSTAKALTELIERICK